MSKEELLVYEEISDKHKSVFDIGGSVDNPPFLEPGDYVKLYVVKGQKKGEKMNQPDLMRQIADAMERNPDGWWREFERQVYVGHCQQQWIQCCSPVILFDELKGDNIRPKPKTYTLHIEGMPDHTCCDVGIGINGKTVAAHMTYSDTTTAQQAMNKLKAAMGASYE